MTQLTDFLADLNRLYTHNYELAAIWLEKPLQTATERTVRITEGHLVRVEDEQLKDCNEKRPANYKVIGCYGTLISSELYFVLTGIENNEPLTIKIK